MLGEKVNISQAVKKLNKNVPQNKRFVVEKNNKILIYIKLNQTEKSQSNSKSKNKANNKETKGKNTDKKQNTFKNYRYFQGNKHLHFCSSTIILHIAENPVLGGIVLDFVLYAFLILVFKRICVY